VIGNVKYGVLAGNVNYGVLAGDVVYKTTLIRRKSILSNLR